MNDRLYLFKVLGIRLGVIIGEDRVRVINGVRFEPWLGIKVIE
jgi:hypothetical protein